ncbi:hypothetical protein MRB53_027522 [Persea americana]|uniref:Uncharacterized protein n=1 Tax=Persea americana TaxID=3435 RepID=A0ACC2LLA4_PERAE|nr:hypothetical protein MRB53_027522 [Persea americana]
MSQEQEDLQKQYKHLRHDWSSFKKSNPRHSSRRRRGAPKPAEEILDLTYTSPRKLISSLQEGLSPSDGWKVRTNDLAIEEIIKERHAAIENGKLKGRRLFDAMESGGEFGLHGKEEICSACSSILIQRSEVQSLFSCTSYDDEDGNGCGNCDSDCSCSCSSSVCVERIKKELTSVEKKGGVDGDDGCEERGRGMVPMAWLVLVLLLVVLNLILSWRSLDGEEDDWMIVPT